MSSIIEPATLVAESNRLTAKSYSEVTKIVVNENLFSLNCRIFIIFKIHVCAKTSLCIGTVIYSRLCYDTHTAVPVIGIV